MSGEQLSVEQRNKRTLKKLLIWAVAMFGFAFLMVPFYNVICDVTGLNGKTSRTAATQVPENVVADRTVTVEFITQKGDGIGGEFSSETKRVKVHPGVITQSIPSVTPGEAARYLHKTQCFCFDQQTLLAGERKDMPMIFYLDPDIPSHINQFTLSYTIFDVTERVAGKNNSVAVN